MWGRREGRLGRRERGGEELREVRREEDMRDWGVKSAVWREGKGGNNRGGKKGGGEWGEGRSDGSLGKRKWWVGRGEREARWGAGRGERRLGRCLQEWAGGGGVATDRQR